VSGLRAPGYPEQEVRRRATIGALAAFPPVSDYGRHVFGPGGSTRSDDLLDAVRLVPPVFMPQRLEKLIELGREPMYSDVALDATVGGLLATAPVFLSAFGSTKVASTDLGMAAARQSGRIGIPMVVGENVAAINGYASATPEAPSLLRRINAYTEAMTCDRGGVVVQQSTEDADAEVWNHIYSDTSTQQLLMAGRLAFELKVGQGAKPGLGGMTMIDVSHAERIADRYVIDRALTAETGAILRSSSPGTITPEILRQQIRLMRNNFPRVKVWVKLHPGRDVGEAARVAWAAGADAVTVDGAEGGTGWAPTVFLDHVGLPLAECLRRIGRSGSCLLVCGGMWEGARAVKSLALGATAVGLGRAALLAVDEDPRAGLARFVECLTFEMQLLISALGKYSVDALGTEDIHRWPAADDDDGEALLESGGHAAPASR
jgi:isopentenyl diphosphate isomerase/L-lactate dehydrogenase-like FMN-dependent dehydrogenase